MLVTKNEATDEFGAAWYAYRQRTTPVNDAILEPQVISALLPIEGEILADLGCGDGEFLHTLAKHNPARLLGIDINHFLLTIAETRIGENGFVAEADISKGLPLQRESVSRIVCNNVLMHLDPEEVRRGAEEMFAALKPFGRAVVSVVHFNWAQNLYTLEQIGRGGLCCTKNVSGNIFREWYRTGAEYEQIFTGAGFRIKERRDLLIPEKSNLPERYSSRSGMPIYELFVLEKW